MKTKIDASLKAELDGLMAYNNMEGTYLDFVSLGDADLAVVIPVAKGSVGFMFDDQPTAVLLNSNLVTRDKTPRMSAQESLAYTLLALSQGEVPTNEIHLITLDELDKVLLGKVDGHLADFQQCQLNMAEVG